jgi:hypothetical protein
VPTSDDVESLFPEWIALHRGNNCSHYSVEIRMSPSPTALHRGYRAQVVSQLDVFVTVRNGAAFQRGAMRAPNGSITTCCVRRPW